MTVIGVIEHKLGLHPPGAQADGFVTVITDLAAVVAGHGPLLGERGAVPGLAGPDPEPDRERLAEAHHVGRLQEHHVLAGGDEFAMLQKFLIIGTTPASQQAG